MAKQDKTSPPPPLVQGSDPPLELNETHKQNAKMQKRKIWPLLELLEKIR